MLILRQKEFVSKKKQNRKLLRAAENEMMHVNRAATKALKAKEALNKGEIELADQYLNASGKAVKSARMDGGRLEQVVMKISKTRPSALSDKELRINEVGVKAAKVLVNPNTKTVHAGAVFGHNFNPNTTLLHNLSPDGIATVNFKSNNKRTTSIIPRSTASAYGPNVHVYEGNEGRTKRLVSNSSVTRKALDKAKSAVKLLKKVR